MAPRTNGSLASSPAGVPRASEDSGRAGRVALKKAAWPRGTYVTSIWVPGTQHLQGCPCTLREWGFTTHTPVDFQCFPKEFFLHSAEESWIERERKEDKRGESQLYRLEGRNPGSQEQTVKGQVELSPSHSPRNRRSWLEKQGLQRETAVKEMQ